jgi:hypothetical protein
MNEKSRSQPHRVYQTGGQLLGSAAAIAPYPGLRKLCDKHLYVLDTQTLVQQISYTCSHLSVRDPSSRYGKAHTFWI